MYRTGTSGVSLETRCLPGNRVNQQIVRAAGWLLHPLRMSSNLQRPS
jgi:hypothetical protein